jgi:hypothetical protein
MTLALPIPKRAFFEFYYLPCKFFDSETNEPLDLAFYKQKMSKEDTI